ncbi:putative Holliday junction resolvase [Pullulanibacillus pueri]|uniref:Putative pre-16S rRNA nuclease n=1 Tax=Pullulanibacillus pueri TaxID=1437324 RepID=A0A8J3ENV3_9BACL|nr:Holliday junction resolvase RuvX [Pullulanibacillus pueri]MBM7683241.1 putative Holliday junction resolvase [Pullulanibacillus pueri]GGH85702.1 putative pre-16S rRNA nuclease [Pullulanibacillus pueri]
MRVMGLDYGTKTVGIAVSDALGLTAQGVETIHYQQHRRDVLYERIGQLVLDYEVSRFVVGLPKNMNGTVGERGEACISFGNQLNKRFDLPVEMYDERLTTMAAERILIEADVSRKKRKKVIDKTAAVLILQGYLDRNRNGVSFE